MVCPANWPSGFCRLTLGMLLLWFALPGEGARGWPTAALPGAPATGARAEIGALEAGVPAPVTRRTVCPLLTPDGSQASIVGQDGGMSVRVDGISYWVFGDTTLVGARMIPNSIATSTDRDGSDCISLTYKQEGGVATPLLPVSGDPEEATVWPVTLVPAVQGRVHFFYASIASEPSPFALRFIGLASFDTETLTATRLGGAGGEAFSRPSGVSPASRQR